MDAQMDYDSKTTVVCNPLTASGAPAEVDGLLAWEVVNDPELLLREIIVSDDGKTCEVFANDNQTIGSGAVVEVTGDADLGDGVEPIKAQIVFTVTHPKAASLGISLSVSPK